MEEVRSGAYPNGDRIKRLRERVKLLEEQSPQASLETTAFTETVALWIDVLEIGARYLGQRNASPAEDAEAEDSSFVSRMNQSNVDSAIDALARLNPRETGAATQAAWSALGVLRGELHAMTSSNAQPLPRLFGGTSSPRELDTAAHITVWLSRVELLSELLRSMVVLTGTTAEVEALKESVDGAAKEAKDASRQLAVIREELHTARAERAQDQLATQFEKLYGRENFTSWLFRLAAFGLLLGSGWFLFQLADSQPTADWQAAATHIAIATLVGGASAYAARLAAAHRGTADWAKSIQVQLDTFQDFLGAIDHDETRHRVYEDFGRRVLGPPPASGDDPGTMPTAQLIELLLASARRPPRDGTS